MDNRRKMKLLALDKVIKWAEINGFKIRRIEFDDNELEFYIDDGGNFYFRDCVQFVECNDEIVGVIVKLAYKGRFERQLKLATKNLLGYENGVWEENHLVFYFTTFDLGLEEDRFDLEEYLERQKIISEDGFISSEKLLPVCWEAWKYSNDKWTMGEGKPYVIDGFVAVLPNNRLYVKEWFAYPFLYEFDSFKELSKMYFKIREKLVERISLNDDFQRTCKIEELPSFEDMWEFEKGKYSCKEYADKMLYGYRVEV